MQDIEDLLKFIFPLIFLAFWALSSLFNRETRPAPVRTGQGLGPRPGGPPGPRVGDRPGGAVVTREAPTMRWGESSSPEPARMPTRADEEILIIRPETLRTPSQTRPAAAPTTARRQGRARPSGAARRAEGQPTRQLGGTTGVQLPQQIGLTVDLAPTPIAPMVMPQMTSPTSVASALAPNIVDSLPPFDIKRLTGSREKLRDAIVLNEILQPPLALRGLRRGR